MGRSQLHAHVCPFLRFENDILMPDSAVSIKDTPAAEWDKNTWPVLDDLARNHPESGIHFQSKAALNDEDGRDNVDS